MKSIVELCESAMKAVKAEKKKGAEEIAIYGSETERKLNAELVKAAEVDAKLRRFKRATSDKALLDTFTFAVPNIDDMLARERAEDEAFNDRLPFVNPELTDRIPLLSGQIVLIGAISGTGKTTTCAAMTEAILSATDKKVLVLSNEEKDRDFFLRLACLQLGVSFNEYKRRKSHPDTIARVRQEVYKLKDRVVFENSPLTRSMEGVRRILTDKDLSQFGVVFVDYVQGIRSLNLTAGHAAEKQVVLEEFKGLLTEYGQEFGLPPLICFTQLKPHDHKDPERNFETRIKWCTSLYEAATVAVEVINLPNANASAFYIAKDRFGSKNQLFSCAYDKGRFVYLPPAEFEAYKAANIAKATLSDMNADLKDDIDDEVAECEV